MMMMMMMSGPDEHRLKLLETNFNQISIGHHTDESLVETCLDKYKEKFFKADTYLNTLFDELAADLNKLVNCVNDLGRLGNGGGEKDRENSEQAADLLDEKNNNKDNLAYYGLTRSNKKFIQDNLNHLHRTIDLVRKSMIELVITSTMIGSLKQVCCL